MADFHSHREADRQMPEEVQPPIAAEPGGIWFLDGGGLTRLAASEAGNPIVLVPSEHVLMLAVDLPLPSRRQRLSALPFAVEDQIADPIGDVHAALGMELAPRRHLAGIVRHALMKLWVEQLTAAGLVHAVIVPDALALPVPEEGSWSAQRSGDRVLVRTPDGAGFATSAAQLPVIWAAAGKPVCIDHGEPLPAEVASVPAVVELEPLTRRLMVPALDLRQGLYARPRRALPRVARKAMAIVAAAALAHAFIAVLDTFALQQIAEERRGEAQALASRHLPGVDVSGDFAAEVNELLAGGAGGPRSSFFPLLARASAAIGASGGGTALRSLSYDAAAGELSFEVEQSDMDALQRTEAALAGAGLSPVSGKPYVAGGVAGARIVVRDPASGIGG